MPPSESSILTNFLLPPAPLPAVLSLRQFAALFPAELRDAPPVRALYRELQHQRSLQTDAVQRNIAAEARRGARQMRQVARARREAVGAEMMEGVDARDVQMEADLFGPSGGAPQPAQHSLATIEPELARACGEVEAEIAGLETEAAALRETIKARVGDLSDLRYGHFSQPGGGGAALGEEVVESLRQLEAMCRDEGG